MKAQSANVIHAIDAHIHNRGVMATRGHLASNGGLRGHSVGDVFPYIVFARGTFEGLQWCVKCPNGDVMDETFSSPRAASDYVNLFVVYNMPF